MGHVSSHTPSQMVMLCSPTLLAAIPVMASISLCAGMFSGVDSVGVDYNDSGAERFMTRTEEESVGTVLTSGCSSCQHSPDKPVWWFTAKHDTEIGFKVDFWENTSCLPLNMRVV